MADSSDVDNAVIAKLGADATLLSYMVNGVFWEEAPEGSTKFVLVSLVDEHDAPMFGARAFEDALYLVKAVAKGTSGIDVKAAAARIDVLLDNSSLTVSGYSLMNMRRDSRVRYTEVDDIDASIRWQHRGGRYQVVVST
jgi:hypothetical protein